MNSLALARIAFAVSCLVLIFAWTGSAVAVEEDAADEPIEYVDDEVYEDDEEPVEYVDDEVYEDDEETVDEKVGEVSREIEAGDLDEDADEGLRTIDSFDEVEIDPDELSPVVRAQRSDVEDLYVTATKRAESVQDVPISMKALSSAFLDDAGITGFGQISEYVPNLTINPVTDTRGTVIRIRGIGSVGTNAGIDPSVGVFVDGVYQGRAGMSVGDLLDIERVEVLRGPQGTLYGKNTAAGLINIISKRPSYDYEATLEGVFGNYSDYEGRGSINIPIVDEHVATRLSAYGVTRDGFDKRLNVGGRTYLPNSTVYDYRNDEPFVFQDDRVNNANKWGFKSRTVFDITDSVSFLLTGDYSYENTKCCIADIITYEGYPTLIRTLNFQNLARPVNQAVLPLGGTGIPLPKADPFDRVVSANAEPKNKVKIGGIALEGTYELPDMALIGGSTLNFIGSWRTYSSDSQFDGDFSYYDAVVAWTEVSLDQYSAELRFASPGGELIDYQVGAYFFHSDMVTLDRNGFESDFVLLFPAAPAGTQNIGDNTHKTYSYAGFAQATITPIEQISATGGVRVSYEEKTRVGTQFSNFPACDPAQNPDLNGCLDTPPIFGPPTSADQKRAVTNVSGMATLRYFPIEDIMLYGSFATGFKSGGFNQLRTKVGIPGEFDDEESMNVEGGFKSSFFDRMITFNATGFYTEYDEFQAQTFDGSSINVINAGKLTSWGIEADLVVVPLPNLVIGSSLGFNIAKYTSFDLGEATSEQKWFGTINPNEPVPPGQEPQGNPLLCNGDVASLPAYVDPSACIQDLAGKRLDSAPDWSLSAFIQYDYLLPWFPIEVFARGEYSLTTTRYLATDLDPNLKQNTSHVVNLRAGFRSENRLWEITAWVRNVTDEGYNVVGFDVPTINGYAGVNAPPRQYGLTVRFEFADLTALPGLFGI